MVVPIEAAVRHIPGCGIAPAVFVLLVDVAHTVATVLWQQLCLLLQWIRVERSLLLWLVGGWLRLGHLLVVDRLLLLLLLLRVRMGLRLRLRTKILGLVETKIISSLLLWKRREARLLL